MKKLYLLLTALIVSCFAANAWVAFFRVPEGWGNNWEGKVHVHAWNGSGDLTSWPGIKMTKYEGDTYRADINGTPTGIQFNDGSDANKIEPSFNARNYYVGNTSSTKTISLPSTLYLIGNVNSNGWNTSSNLVSASNSNGIYKFNNVKVSGNFTLITATGDNWDAVNNSNRFGAQTKEYKLSSNGTEAFVIPFPAGINASGATNWTLDSGTYNITVDLNNYTIKAEEVNTITDLYLRGGMTNWEAQDPWKFSTTDGVNYTLTLPAAINAGVEFKVGSDDWGKNWGLPKVNDNPQSINLDQTYTFVSDKDNVTLKEQAKKGYICTFNSSTGAFKITPNTITDDTNVTVAISYQGYNTNGVAVSGNSGAAYYIVTLTPSPAASRVYYTLDGNTPTENSAQYTGVPFMIASNCTLKAIAYYDNSKSKNVAQQTFSVTTDEYSWEVPNDKDRLAPFRIPSMTFDVNDAQNGYKNVKYLTADVTELEQNGYDAEYSWAKYYDYDLFEANKNKTYSWVANGQTQYATYAAVCDHFADDDTTVDEGQSPLVGENTTSQQQLRHFYEFGDAHYRFYVHFNGNVPLANAQQNSRTKSASHAGTVDPTANNRIAFNRTLQLTYGATTGVEDVIADFIEDGNNADGPVVFYNLQGVRVENPANGVYIRVQGTNVEKVLVH